MSNLIYPGYGAGLYGYHAKTGGVRQSGIKGSSFSEMAEQSAAKGSSFLETAKQVSQSAVYTQTVGVSAAQAEGVEAAEAPTLETMLKAKYPNLVYHVFDASSGYWRTRNDYPHYLLYQSGDKAKETLENWQPEGPNPFYGSKNGKFIAPKEIHALGNVPPGSKAVVIHPKVQERMEQDPAYAKEIMEKIDTWFTFDVLRNEALRSGSTVGMSQAVAIGEDGNICNAVSSSSGGEITYSSDEMVRAYYLRMAKRAEFMRYLAKKQAEESAQNLKQISEFAALSSARSKLAEMLNSGRLQEIFGDEIAGTPTEKVLDLTRAEIWGG